MNPLVIGLTGGIGAGKTTTAHLIKEHGAEIIEVDQLGRDLLHKDLDAKANIVKEFGESILDETGKIDRGKLGRIVFGNVERLQTLEAISHPAINQILNRLIGKQSSGVIILDMAVLVEKKLAYFQGSPMYQKVVVVESEMVLRNERLKQRGLTDADIEKRIKSQATDDERAEVADYVITNNGSMRDLQREVKNLWDKIGIWRVHLTNDCMSRESKNK
tara:strand:+ start:333 stop:986 length:654 start_codon:yes stop_codon:yes gene_type:complete